MRVRLGVWVVVWLGVAAAGCSVPEEATESRSHVRASTLPLVALGPEIGTTTPVPVQKDVGWNPAVGSDGSGFLSVVTIANQVRGVRVDASGKVLDSVWLTIGDAL